MSQFYMVGRSHYFNSYLSVMLSQFLQCTLLLNLPRAAVFLVFSRYSYHKLNVLIMKSVSSVKRCRKLGFDPSAVLSSRT